MTELINGQAIRRAVIKHYQQHQQQVVRLGRRVVVVQVTSALAASDEWKLRCQASAVSARAKNATFTALGYTVDERVLDPDVSSASLQGFIGEANADPRVSGVIVQMPVPERLIDAVQTISLAKDLDHLSVATGRAVCATADGMTRLAVPHLTAESTVAVHGGRGFVGSGIVRRLRELGHHPMVVDHNDDPTPLRSADVVFSTVGKPHCLTQELVGDREVPLIIDSGFTPTRSGDPVAFGDTHPDVAARARKLTPVPGGIGPVEMAVLAERVLQRDLGDRVHPWSYDGSSIVFRTASGRLVPAVVADLSRALPRPTLARPAEGVRHVALPPPPGTGRRQEPGRGR